MPNEQEIRFNLKAVENAVAQQRLEGLEVPLEVIEDMKRAARGEIDIADGIRNTYEKFAHGEVRGQDHYLDPETGVLRNRLGVTDESELEKAEASFVAWRSYELSQKPIAGHFDLAHLQAIHRHLFGDVYDWAGEIRTIDLSREIPISPTTRALSGSQSDFRKLAKEQSLKGLGTAAFSERAAYYLGEINALHPFREGNGRAQREFINHLARANGYGIDWTSMSPEAMTQASIEAFHRGDTAKFAAFICENIRQWPTSG